VAKVVTRPVSTVKVGPLRVFGEIILAFGSGISPKNLARGGTRLFCHYNRKRQGNSCSWVKIVMMTKLINLGQQVAMWWHIAKFILAAIVVMLLIWQGLHPAWGVLLFIFREASVRVCVFLGLLYWLTHGLI
jgi:hypothetical protein